MIGPARNITNREQRASPGRVDQERHDAMPIVPSFTGVQQAAFRQETPTPTRVASGSPRRHLAEWQRRRTEGDLLDGLHAAAPVAERDHQTERSAVHRG